MVRKCILTNSSTITMLAEYFLQSFDEEGEWKLEIMFMKHYVPTLCLSRRVHKFSMPKFTKGNYLKNKK